MKPYLAKIQNAEKWTEVYADGDAEAAGELIKQLDERNGYQNGTCFEVLVKDGETVVGYTITIERITNYLWDILEEEQ